MKLLIKIQCFCTFLGITLFLLFFKIQTEALLECTLSRYTLHILTQALMTPQNLFIETHNGTHLLAVVVNLLYISSYKYKFGILPSKL